MEKPYGLFWPTQYLQNRHTRDIHISLCLWRKLIHDLKSSHTKEHLAQMAFLMLEYIKPFKEEIRLVLCKTSQGIEKGGIVFNSFYEASITLIPKPDLTIVSVEQKRSDRKQYLLFDFIYMKSSNGHSRNQNNDLLLEGWDADWDAAEGNLLGCGVLSVFIWVIVVSMFTCINSVNGTPTISALYVCYIFF